MRHQAGLVLFLVLAAHSTATFAQDFAGDAVRPVPKRTKTLIGTYKNEKINLRPVIGVLSQPTSKKDQELHGGATDRCYIAASYTKWVEGSGAMVLPIPYNVSNEVLDHYFDNVNGILFTGGGCQTNLTKFYYTFQYLFDKAVAANLKGDYFPLWGICQGFQMMGVMSSTSKQVDILKRFDTLNYAINLDFTPNADKSKIYAFTGKKVMNDLAERPIAFNNHNWGFDPADIAADKALADFWEITSTSVDREGKVFVSTLEGKTMPFYALQWHPEKPIYEWEDRLLIEHDPDTIFMGQMVGNFFVSEARKNFHHTEEYFESKMIWNRQPSYTTPLGSEFEQCYFFNSVEWQD